MQRLHGWKRLSRTGIWATLVAALLFLPISIAQQSAPLTGTDQGVVPTKPAPPPKAVFKETKHAFGDVQRGEPMSHTFVVKNEGEGPLTITNVSPG